VTGLGGYQGYCVNMDLKNLSKDSLIIEVEAGRRLNSLDDKVQDILIVKEEFISLRNLEEKNFKIKGYCCQASNSAPPANAKYDVNKMADSNLVKLARFLNAGKFNNDTEQQAIWALSDKKPTATISGINDTLLLPLKQLVCNMKGEVMPWYSLISGTYVFNNGTIYNYPLVLKGKLAYSSDTEEYATLYVFDAKGQQVCQVKCEWIKSGQNNSFALNIPVKGLAKGKYSIALKTPQKELAKKEFEI
ncbi:MAG: hypothetical protein IT236_16845, partial [Bacteroidia bacterium]|nr:hypothetical protein [Bacteroidia bacterium]